MNYEWIGKTIKKSDPKIKNQSEIAACEQKTTSEKAIFLFKHRFLTLLLN